MQKALTYSRVSTEEQVKEGYSLDAQEKRCYDFALNNQLRIVGEYRDEGRSGTTLDRPGLKDLLTKCQQDKSINVVLVQETDRLARNTQDHLAIRAILQKAGVKLISVAQPMLDDSPEGKMIDTILASVNQFQSDINSRKTIGGLQKKFDSGWWPGWARLGYTNVTLTMPDGRTIKITKPDPERWHLVKEGFKLYLTGNYSVLEIRDMLYEKGLLSKMGKKVSHAIMTDTLQDTFYTGLMRWKQQEKMGKHKPMINMKEHKRVLEIMANHNQHACRRRKYTFLLRGFVFCNICGQRYTAEKHAIQKKNGVLRVEYYHCACRQKHSNRGQNIKVDELERQIQEQFQTIQFTQEFIDRTIEEVKAIYNQRRDKVNKEKQKLGRKKAMIESERDVAEEKLFREKITDEVYARNKEKFKVSLNQIQDQIDELENQREFDINVVQEILKMTRNIYKAYKTAPDGLKRSYLGLFWDKFLVQDKQIVKAVPTQLIQELLEHKQVILSATGLRGQDSNL